MKLVVIVCTIPILLQTAMADTPAPSIVKARAWSGDGNTAITVQPSGAMNVDVVNSIVASITGSALPTNACQETGGHLASIDSKLSTPLPVSGTFWQATQPVSGTLTVNAGTGTMLVDGSAHTQPVSGTFWQATQPVSAASLPLPAGAATSAKQPALGTAGTPSADILTVQGTASMTALKVDGSGVTQPVSGTFWQATQPVSGAITANAGSGTFLVDGSAHTQPVSGALTANIGLTGGLALDTTVAGLAVGQGSTTSGQNGGLTQGATTTAAPTYVTGKTNPLSLTTAGALRTDGSGVTQPVSGTFWQATQPVSLSSLPALSAGSNTIGSVNVNGTVPVSGTFWQATQPVSGTITANVGTTNGLALDTSVNGILLSQGSTTSGQKGALHLGAVTTAAPLYTTGQSSPFSLNTSGGLRVDGSGVTQPVSGTVGVSSLPAIPTGSNTIGAVNVNGTVPVSGTFWQATQPVSGTITANVGTTNGLALDTTVSGLQVAQGSTTSGQKGGLGLGAVSTAAPSYVNAQSSPFSLTTVGALRVDNSAVTQPVSGTFWQATQPVSAASLPLPSGAATSVKQPALGTAGTPSTDVLTVQGATSMTALKVDGSAVTQPVSGTFWQATQPVSLASLPALPTGSNVIGALSSNQTVNVSQINGVTPLMGNGVTGTGSARVTIASDNSAISTKAPVNANGSLSARQTVTTTESNLSAPSNAVAVIIEAESGNADNIRWGLSNSTTAILSSTLGMLTEPGRSFDNVPAGTGTVLHLIATGGGTDNVDIQWVLAQ